MVLKSLLLIVVLTGPSSFAKIKDDAPAGSPSRAIQELDDHLDAYILRPKTDQERAHNAGLKKKILHGTFDIRELCRRALDRHWDDMSGRERDRFVDLMTRLLEKKAIFSKEQGGGGRNDSKAVYFITYEGQRFLSPDQSQALVMTSVRIPSENLTIGLHYKLGHTGGIWKIYDVIVDDASLAENYKYQFDKIIREHGYGDLVRRMESKLKELIQKEGGVPAPPPPEPKPAAKGGCSLSDA